MLTLLQGVLTGGFSFLGSWWKGKQEQAVKELDIVQEEKRTEQTIRLKRASAAEGNTSERIKQMNTSWKDEVVMLIFYTPLVASIISPFIDLYFAIRDTTYIQGMLAKAASDAVGNFSSMPLWYILIVLLIALYSWGASKEVIDRFFGMFSFKK
tara:strand:+ start:1197 stop:1658 length:462 start_codon:yes stop_codon:yes gene_type:complete